MVDIRRTAAIAAIWATGTGAIIAATARGLSPWPIAIIWILGTGSGWAMRAIAEEVPHGKK